MEKRYIVKAYPELHDVADFMVAYRRRHHTVRLGEPEPEVVSKEEMPQIRP